MLKVRLQSYFRLLILLAGLQIFTEAQAQAVDVEILVDQAERRATVKGRFRDAFRPLNGRNLAFKQEVAGFAELAGRIENVGLKSSDGKAVSARRLMAGEYLAESDFEAWSYTVNLSPAKNRIAAAHASWLVDKRGVLMLDDLLPIFSTRDQPVSGRIALKLPDNWAAYSADGVKGPMSFDAPDITGTVILIGDGLRNRDVQAESGKLSLVLSGEWLFSDDEAAGMACEIFDEYSKLLGKLPDKSYQIAVLKFPGPEGPGAWQAETRGRTVTIISSDMPFKTQSQQRLHEQLRHEIFHLWFPNAVRLIGDYAWFYEGFALYMSLKLGVKLNRIRFDDFLETLARAHTIDTNGKPRRALTAAGIDPAVRYARGLLVAFLADIQLLVKNGGGDDVGKRLKNLFARPTFAGGVGADEAVATVITDPSLISRYVKGVENVNWTAELAATGIESQTTGRTTTLSVAPKLKGRQRRILDRLGYNNWRKIGTKR